MFLNNKVQFGNPDLSGHLSLTANKDVHAVTQKSSSILPITHFKFKRETSGFHFIK